MKAADKKPIVCYVTDRKSLGGTGIEVDPIRKILEHIRKALDAQVDWVQIREKDLPARELLGLAQQAVKLAAERGSRAKSPARIIINDRLDVPLVSGAQGVHLGRESVAARDVVRWCRAGNAPAEFAIGISCHSLKEAREADSSEVDYIFFGPIFETPSKKEFGAPQGIERLAEVCRAVKTRVIAIGGVNQENARNCSRAGAHGVAAIRLFQGSRNTEAVRQTVASIHALGIKEG